MSGESTHNPAPASASATKRAQPREKSQDKGELQWYEDENGKPRQVKLSRDERAALKAVRGQVLQTDLFAAQASAAAPAAAPVAPAAAPAAAPAVDAEPEVFADWQPIDGMIMSSWVSGGPPPDFGAARSAPPSPAWVPPAFPFRPSKKVVVDRVPSLGIRVPVFKKNFRSCLTPGLVDRSCHGRLESI